MQRVAHAELRLGLSGRRGHAVRDHVAVLITREDASEPPMVICSVHLHPPVRQFGEAGCTMGYRGYLEPLRDMLRDLSSSASGAPADILLLGDFNVAYEDFRALTLGDPFWQSFVLVGPSAEHGPTAHHSNPCEHGDYALFQPCERSALRRDVAWRCEVQGPRDFQAFEQFCNDLVGDALLELPLVRLQSYLSCAAESFAAAAQELERGRDLIPTALRAAPAPAAAPPRHHGDGPTRLVRPRPPPPSAAAVPRVPHRPPPPPVLTLALPPFVQDTLAMLQTYISLLGQLRFHRPPSSSTVRKGLLTSDHRPLLLEEVVNHSEGNVPRS